MNKYLKKNPTHNQNLHHQLLHVKKIYGKLTFKYEPHCSRSASVYAQLILTGAMHAPGGVNKSLGLWDWGLEKCMQIRGFPHAPHWVVVKRCGYRWVPLPARHRCLCTEIAHKEKPFRLF